MEFLGDIVAVLRPEENYDHDDAFELVIKQLIELM